MLAGRSHKMGPPMRDGTPDLVDFGRFQELVETGYIVERCDDKEDTSQIHAIFECEEDDTTVREFLRAAVPILSGCSLEEIESRSARMAHLRHWATDRQTLILEAVSESRHNSRLIVVAASIVRNGGYDYFIVEHRPDSDSYVLDSGTWAIYGEGKVFMPDDWMPMTNVPAKIVPKLSMDSGYDTLQLAVQNLRSALHQRARDDEVGD